VAHILIASREVLRKKISPALFFVFNVVFISLAQNILLFLVSTPTYVMLLVSRFNGTMGTADIIFARILMGLILVEFLADQQQWSEYYSGIRDIHISNLSVADYQKAKKAYQKSAKVPPGFNQEDLDRGFVVTGLWSWSRHPNFAAEQAIWVIIYQWGCWASEVLYNWTILGAMSYIFLFQASTWFTELITSSKYPDYKEYQQLVGKFLPIPGSSLPAEPTDQQAKPKPKPKTKEGRR